MPKFNDGQPDPRFWSTRKLLQTLGALVPADPSSIEFQAMATLWARMVERQTTFKRRAVAHKPRSRRSSSRPKVEALDPFEAALDALPATDIDLAANKARIDAALAEQDQRAGQRQRDIENSVWGKLLDKNKPPE